MPFTSRYSAAVSCYSSTVALLRRTRRRRLRHSFVTLLHRARRRRLLRRLRLRILFDCIHFLQDGPLIFRTLDCPFRNSKIQSAILFRLGGGVMEFREIRSFGC